MKAEADIQDRIRELLDGELARRVASALEQLPAHCVHNHRHTLDGRKRVDGEPNELYNRISDHRLPIVQTIGLCMLGAEKPEEWSGTVCEDPVDAQRCPYFTLKHNASEVQTAFEAQLRDVGWVRENLPEVHALLWAIGAEGLEHISSHADLFSGLSWWQRLLLRLIGLSPLATKRLPRGCA